MPELLRLTKARKERHLPKCRQKTVHFPSKNGFTTRTRIL